MNAVAFQRLGKNFSYLVAKHRLLVTRSLTGSSIVALQQFSFSSKVNFVSREVVFTLIIYVAESGTICGPIRTDTQTPEFKTVTVGLMIQKSYYLFF